MALSPAIQRLWKKMEKDQSDLFDLLDKQDQEILSLRPQQESWSVLQVMEHLRMAESLSFQYIVRKSGSPEKLKKKDLMVRFRELNLAFFLNSPFKFKAPDVVNEEVFPEVIIYENQKRDWQQNRRELHVWLSKQPDRYFQLQMYRHPYAGRMGIDGMLKFFNLHFKRHRKQIERTLAQLSS